MRQMKAMRGFVLRWFEFSIFLTGMGCQGKSPTIHYVLPNGYRGAFMVITGQPDGVEPRGHNGRYICNVPESGVLRVRGKGPFDGWHSITAAYSNGEVIPIEMEVDDLRQERVAFWYGDSRPGGRIYFFVGTSAQNKQFRNETALGPPKVLGRVRESSSGGP
jgi:hypothetical protein